MCSNWAVQKACGRQRFHGLGCLVALVICGFCSSAVLGQEGGTISLQDQLKAQYDVVKFTADMTGIKITKPGTVLSVKKGGLLALPPMSMVLCPAKFQDNDLKPPSGLCAAMAKQQNSRFLEVGEKVYPLRIDVLMDKDRVIFQLVECDSCNGVQQPSYYKAEVIFQFAKGALHTMAVPQVEDTISEVLSIDSGDDQGSNNGGDGNNQGGQDQGNNNSNGGGGNQAQQQQGPPQEPQQISMGQTIDQVKSALGTPEKIVNLGAKQIYVYKDLKVTFVNGKVSDVQ
jgi:hypothetical protein